MRPWSIQIAVSHRSARNSSECEAKTRMPGALDQLVEPGAGLGEELGVDRADALVEQEDLRVDAGDDAEREPHPHPGGVGAQRHRQVVAELGERGDVVDAGLHLLAGHAEEEAADEDVVQAGDLRVHADGQVEHRRDLAQHPRVPPRGLVDARHEAQQRGLARPVVPDERHPVACAQGHGDVAQRLDDRHLRLGADPAARPAEHGLLQRAGLGVEDREVDARALDVDGDHGYTQ